ncbi:MAG: hypothetical protein CVU38_08305 [Chloroflexi bacterium HGW-Chloroflexi-1]|nr:MAG: hypothetical protein CVU38_08305 [Chloroflexi bacterium HGW-Chloroflexi-1]
MKIRAIADQQAAVSPSAGLAEFEAMRELLGCVSGDYGPVLRASSFLGTGGVGGGSYSGYSELYDLDGLMRDSYCQPSMEPGVNDTLFGGGKGFALGPTLLSTVGEAVERGIATLVGCSPYLPDVRVVGSYQDMVRDGRPAVDPEGLGLFSEQQYASPRFLYKPFTRDSKVMWLRARRVVSGDEVWVPAQLVDMVHIFDACEDVVGYPVSGGLSCHISPRAALYHGLTEVIERDAVNVSWYTAAVPARVRLGARIREQLGGFVDRFELDHSEAYLLLHCSDVCSAPTFSFIGTQRWLRRRQYCAGGGCDLVPDSALAKAAVEFGQTRSTLSASVVAPGSVVGRTVEKMFDWTAGRPLAEMTLFFQAIGYYGLDENIGLLDPYLDGPVIDYEDVVEAGCGLGKDTSVEERLEVLLSELSASGIDPIVLDYSHPDWNTLAIMKVFVPQLSNPFMQSRPMLGHTRLAEIRPEIRIGSTAQPLPYP